MSNTSYRPYLSHPSYISYRSYLSYTYPSDLLNAQRLTLTHQSLSTNMSTIFDTHAFDINSKLAIEEEQTAHSNAQPPSFNTEPSLPEVHPSSFLLHPSESPSTLNAQRSSLSLPGRVSAFFLNYKGRKLGPYYVRRWKEKGKAKKQYIQHEDLEQVQAACLRYQQDRNIKKARNLEVNNLIKNMAFMWHMKIRVKKGARLRIEDILHLGKIERSGMAISGTPKLRKPNHGFMAPLFAKWLRTPSSCAEMDCAQQRRKGLGDGGRSLLAFYVSPK